VAFLSLRLRLLLTKHASPISKLKRQRRDSMKSFGEHRSTQHAPAHPIAVFLRGEELQRSHDTGINRFARGARLDQSRVASDCVAEGSPGSSTILDSKAVEEIFNEKQAIRGLEELQRKISRLQRSSHLVWFDKFIFNAAPVKGTEQLGWPPRKSSRCEARA
jgi:hypothetical protein